MNYGRAGARVDAPRRAARARPLRRHTVARDHGASL